MADGKRHQIKTLQDICRAVTSENVDRFLTDFEMFMTTWAMTRAVIEMTNPESLEKTIESANFVWVDDGKHDIKIKVAIAKE